MPYTTVNVNTEVDIDLEDIDLYDMIDYVEDCGYTVLGLDDADDKWAMTRSELENLYEAYRSNRDEFEKQIVNMFYKTIGRIA